MIEVEVFSSPGCSRCGHAKEQLKQICLEQGNGQIQWREVNILEELDYAVELGVLSTPAIAINKKLVFTGLPGTNKLRTTLLDYLKQEQKP